MTNAAMELLRIVNHTGSKIICAEISIQHSWEDSTSFFLKKGYSQEDYERFINSLNFDYDAGFGGQNLFGTVWLEDGSWLARGEYDGSEWWNHLKLPEIPQNLMEGDGFEKKYNKPDYEEEDY